MAGVNVIVRLDEKTKHDFDAFCDNVGIKINPVTSTFSILDEDDRIFYDTAQACGAVLITGNAKHYPSSSI